MNISDSLGQTLRGTLAQQNLQREQAQPAQADAMRNQFLTLLTAQMRNQDPMNPMENAEMTSQLAQMSTVDGIERLNAQLATLSAGQSDAQAVQAASMIGKGVMVPGSRVVLTDQETLAGFSLDSYAGEVNVSIHDATGAEIYSAQLQDMEPGNQIIVWDGSTHAGVRAAQGTYTLKVSASLEEDAVDVRPLQFGVVSSIVKGPKGVNFQVGDAGIFKTEEIQSIL